MLTNHPKLNYISKWFKNVLHIYDPIYRMNFFYFKGSRKLCNAQAQKLFNVTWNLDKNLSGNFSVYIIGGQEAGLIWAADLPALVHECTHATIYTLSDRGVGLIDPKGEAYAYYTAFLYREITRKL